MNIVETYQEEISRLLELGTFPHAVFLLEEAIERQFEQADIATGDEEKYARYILELNGDMAQQFNDSHDDYDEDYYIDNPSS
jgi:hypothetical protein